MDPTQAAFVTSRQLRQCFVCLLRPPVERNLDRERRELAQVVRDPFIDQNSIGEKRDQKTFALGKGVDLEKVLPREDFAASEQQPNDSHVSKFGEDCKIFFFGQLLITSPHITHCKIVVTVLATQRTASGDLNRNFNRDTFIAEMLVHSETEFVIRSCVHDDAPTPTSVTRPTDSISARNASTSHSICE